MAKLTEIATGTQVLEVVSYEAPGLGDRSYLVHDGGAAVVVDPQRDPKPYLATADELGVEIELVLETHVHNDYVSGGLALARKAGATYGVPAGEPVAFSAQCTALDEGDLLDVGSLRLRVLATPGHTPHHLSYLLEDRPGNRVVLTGGSLLAGATGRTDLFGPQQASALSQAQWSSVRRLLRELPPSTWVLPTHGFGSFCSSSPTSAFSGPRVTIEVESKRNPAAQLELRPFVESLTTAALPVPAYYRHMAPLNRAGPGEPEHRQPPKLELPALAQQPARGAALVDLRPRGAFAARHWRSTVNIELGPSLTTYLGWLVPFDAPLVLLSRSLDEIAEAQALLSRIGREAVTGWASDDVLAEVAAQERGRYEVARFRDLAERSRQQRPFLVVDVRFPHEWELGHIRDALNVPVPEVEGFVWQAELGTEIWVHCAAGYRAAIAASLLSRQGLLPVLVDDVFDNAVAAGLEVVRGPATDAGAGLARGESEGPRKAD